MTQREKAEELLTKAYTVSSRIVYVDAIEFALIAVDEILSEYEEMKGEVVSSQFETYVHDNIKYWQGVKEIILLEKNK